MTGRTQKFLERMTPTLRRKYDLEGGRALRAEIGDDEEVTTPCRYDPEMWFPDDDGQWSNDDKEYAKRVCRTACPFREPCLAAVMNFERGESTDRRHGIWGGLDSKERLVLQHEMDAIERELS